MSGFVALFHRSGRPVDAVVLARLTEGLRWRGPDGWGMWHKDAIGLGRALFRTNAEDEAAGPLGLDGCHLVGDVRLDDRQGLVARLRTGGGTVSDRAPDSELLLRAYLQWDEDCLTRLAGDFSFVLWDERRQRLVAARDQFGVASLFYAEQGDLLIVGNSLRCLLEHPEMDDSLDDDTIADFLAVGERQSRQATFYRSIRRLEGGQSLTADIAGFRLNTYWTMPAGGQAARYRRPADYVREFRDVFDQAVSDRLRCERVSTHLSGGMDASSIAVTLACQMGAETTSTNLRAFTCHFESLIPDDEGWLSQEIARERGIPLDLLTIEPFYDQTAEPGGRIGASEPLWLPHRSPLTELNRRAAAHGRVLFQGFGGDPLFDQRYDPSPSFGIIAFAHALRDLAYGRLAYGRTPWPRPRKWRSRAGSGPVPAPDTLLDTGFARQQGVDGRRRDWVCVPPLPARRGMGRDPLWAQLFDEATSDFTGQPLKVVFPFFDMRLVDFLDRIPAFPWLSQKALLRMAMYDRLPATIVGRRKTGLRHHPRMTHMHRHGPAPWMFDLLKVEGLGRYVNLQAAADVLNEPQRLGCSELFRLEAIWSLAYWLRDRAAIRQPLSG